MPEVLVFPESSMSRKDWLLRVNEALNRLSAKCRNPRRIAIFISHAIFMEPCEEVARRFGVSKYTVSMAKHDMLQKLERQLEEIAEEEAKGLFSKRGDKVFLREEDFSF